MMNTDSNNGLNRRIQCYWDREHFVNHVLEHDSCPHGCDLPPDERLCTICREDIHDNSTVAQICPVSKQHVYHWVCMLQWLATWNDELEAFERKCPTCRTELFTLTPTSWVAETPADAVLKLRDKIAQGWEDMMVARRVMYCSSRLGFVRRSHISEYEPDRALPLRYALEGDHNLATVLCCLNDPAQVEIMRVGAYMTEDETELQHLLDFVDNLLDALSLPTSGDSKMEH
ncbi:hypothetical protein BFW01_g10186 [Lasiodiplodia theobromae]|uniref:RING-type domain-containing protein n=1 Tax=Lasiodiplodia theobromae TaxID=45133 RepID=A0A8H7ILS3_9PEZI|nr:hypothetical protein BFW01_g10186 [Lasiodiplodia theobromae]